MKIQILGTGCTKCHTLAENTKKAVANLGIFAQVEKVEDLNEILSYNVINTPALVIDEVVKSTGQVLSPKEIEKLIKDNL
ncbi:MAG: TM0996/MTH895 family glutaredoxin-like protein [Campylobacteraceae bacterium]|nr:TM0996/MTH895 family glutaredoxin-like protein [Campylobacteraceae bacterium]